MIKSMTGYGRAVETVNGREFTVELRSVNNRYLDCSVRLPRILTFGEDAVKQAVKTAISRGKVDVFITVHAEGGDDRAVLSSRDADDCVTVGAVLTEEVFYPFNTLLFYFYGIKHFVLLSRLSDTFSWSPGLRGGSRA